MGAWLTPDARAALKKGTGRLGPAVRKRHWLFVHPLEAVEALLRRHQCSMPNQRSKDKVYLGGYVNRELHQKLTRLADQAGMGRNRFGFVISLALEGLKARGRNSAARSKSPPARRVGPTKKAGV